MDKKILETASSWGTNPYFNEPDRQEIAILLSNPEDNEAELEDRFDRELDYGAEGFCAAVALGKNRMNIYNVRRMAQVLASKALKDFNGGKVAISYDSRKHSKEFAMEAAGVFAANGIKSLLFLNPTPFPLLSYAVGFFQSQLGMMISGGTRPSNYNGLQIIPTPQGEFNSEYAALTDWQMIKQMTFEDAHRKGLVAWTDSTVDNIYYDSFERTVVQDLELCRTHGKKLFIVHTALHGATFFSCTEIAKRTGFKSFYSIPEQAAPNGDFPTINSPDPENPKALEMAIAHMLKVNADLVFATDPGGLKLGVVVNNHGRPSILNVVQIRALTQATETDSMTLMVRLSEVALAYKQKGLNLVQALNEMNA